MRARRGKNTFDARARCSSSRLRAEATRAAVDEDEAMDLVEDAKRRVYKYYIPVYEEVVSRLRTHRATRGTTPAETPSMVVGVSAPQGCGKTTLTRTIVDLIRETPKKFLDESAANEMGNVTAMTLSVDDFYLTYEEQTALGDAHAGLTICCATEVTQVRTS